MCAKNTLQLKLTTCISALLYWTIWGDTHSLLPQELKAAYEMSPAHCTDLPKGCTYHGTAVTPLLSLAGIHEPVTAIFHTPTSHQRQICSMGVLAVFAGSLRACSA